MKISIDNQLELWFQAYQAEFMFQAYWRGLVPRFRSDSIYFYLVFSVMLMMYGALMTMISIIYGEDLGRGCEIFFLTVLLNIPPWNSIPRKLLYKKF